MLQSGTPSLFKPNLILSLSKDVLACSGPYFDKLRVRAAEKNNLDRFSGQALNTAFAISAADGWHDEICLS